MSAIMQKGQKRAAKNARRLARSANERRRNARLNAREGAPFDETGGWLLIDAVRAMERRSGFAVSTRERLPDEHEHRRAFHEESLVSRLRSVMFKAFSSTFGAIGRPPLKIAAPLVLGAAILTGCGTTGSTKQPEPTIGAPLSGNGPPSRCRERSIFEEAR